MGTDGGQLIRKTNKFSKNSNYSILSMKLLLTLFAIATAWNFWETTVWMWKRKTKWLFSSDTFRNTARATIHVRFFTRNNWFSLLICRKSYIKSCPHGCKKHPFSAAPRADATTPIVCDGGDDKQVCEFQCFNRFRLCKKECIDDSSCTEKCAKKYTECEIECPCHKNCPEGCPCPGWQCLCEVKGRTCSNFSRKLSN